MIISICHQKGGVGKTTLAINLTVELLRQKKDVVLVDLDAQKIASAFAKTRKSLTGLHLPIFIPKDQEELKSFINNNQNRQLIIDCGGYDSTLTRLSMIGSDMVITPLLPTFPERVGLASFYAISKELSKVKKICYNIVFTRVNPCGKSLIVDAKDYITSSYPEFNIFNTVIRHRTDYINSLEKGQSVTEFNSKGQASVEIKDLIKEIGV